MTYEPEDVVAYHGKLAGEWERRYQKRSFRARVEVLEECLRGRDLSDTEWLDAGCGTGTLTRFLAERGCSVLAVDAAPNMIAVAREQAKSHPRERQMRFDVAATIEQLPCGDARFDGILCSSVLEYVANPEQCVTEFARALKPGGLLLVSVPNAESLVRRAQVAVYHWGRRFGRRWLNFVEFSRNEYSRQQFAELLNRHGFECKRVLAFGSPIPRRIQRQRRGGSLLMFLAVRR